MKKICSIICLVVLLLACDLSTSLAPTTEMEDMVATVNSIMTEFPTIQSQPTEISTSLPTLLAPIPSIEFYTTGTILPIIPTQRIFEGTPLPVGSTPSLTVTPSITSTFIPNDPRGTLGSPSWIDTYTKGSNWPQETDKYTSVIFENGFMKLTALTDKDGWRLTYPDISNFYLEASFQTNNCESTDHFGIIFRVPDIAAANQGYFYGIQCDGKYFFRVFIEDKMTSIVYAKANPAILPGKDVVNRLGVMAENDKLSLYVNGTLVNEITDSNFNHGGFGIFVGYGVIKNLTVWVDEIAYWILP